MTRLSYALTGLCLCLLAAPWAAAQIHLDCRIQYKKEGALSHRPVVLNHDNLNNKLVSVTVDGQIVHQFNVSATKILTSVDSERIQIEFELGKITWKSNFRDLYFATGLCIKYSAK